MRSESFSSLPFDIYITSLTTMFSMLEKLRIKESITVFEPN